MSFRKDIVIAWAWCLVLIDAAHAVDFNDLVKDFYSKNISTSLLMTDEEVVQFGFMDFNPNDYIELDDENIGGKGENKLRSDLISLSLPFRYDFEPGSRGNYWIGVKAAYLKHNQDLRFSDDASLPSDKLEELNTILGIGSGYDFNLSTHWMFSAGLYVNWIQYDNSVDFNSSESQALAPYLDGLLTNVDFDVLMAEPIVSINYLRDWGQTHFTLFSKLHYMIGRSFDTEHDAHKINPESWYTTTGVLAKRPFSGETLQGHSLWYRLAQVNTGGDLDMAVGTNRYYEAGIAWLVETPDLGSYVENIGLGININYGSELKGGTIVLLFNK
ncbi:MAG: Solitary outer membrane autotransporter beta-barrel domain [Pseudomonadota bacterium]|nr:Solitary outer membrane autotransporter beta-barrel domain [Pseudomonadota bacterium]